MVGKEHFGEDVGAEIVRDSCGCIFCDLEFDTKEDDGRHYHQITSRGVDGLRRTCFPLCTAMKPRVEAECIALATTSKDLS